MSKLILKISKIFTKIKPDYLIILGDRFEIMIPTIVANHFKIPTIHLHGGEITEGSMDELTRHSISKMSQVHFSLHRKLQKKINSTG